MRAPITEAEIRFYRTHGYFVFRRIIPAALISDLRRSAAQALALARRLHGPQAQRLAAVGTHADVDQAPIRNFTELPELNDGIHALLTPRHRVTGGAALSLLFEPADRCWATEWHRDWRGHLDEAKFAEVFEGRWDAQAADLNLFNQINCALYEDPCTWFVPGTNVRLWDTAEEIDAVRSADRDALENRGAVRTEAEHEHFLRDYCTAMPGAIQLRLEPGDLAIYRSVAWHIGSYVPYRKRATLHCSAMTPEYDAFVQRATQLIGKGA